MDRRDFVTALIGAASLTAAPHAVRSAPREDAWKSEAIDHLLPTVNDRGLWLRGSFRRPLSGAALLIDSRRVAGQRTDTEGKFWEFDAPNLEPDRRYTLTLIDAAGRPLGDPWPIRTFPDRQDTPARLRL